MKEINKKAMPTIFIVVTNLTWLVYLFYFYYLFYKKEYFYVSHQHAFSDKTISLLSYTWSESFLLFFTYLVITVVTIYFVRKLLKSDYPYRIFVWINLLAYQFAMLANVYCLIFIVLFFLSLLISYVVITMKKLRDKSLILYEVGDVIETKGPFKEIPDLIQIKEEYMKDWNDVSLYEIDTECYMENQEYYVDIFVNDIGNKDLGKRRNDVNESK